MVKGIRFYTWIDNENLFKIKILSKLRVIKESNLRLPNSFTKKVFPTCLAPRRNNGDDFYLSSIEIISHINLFSCMEILNKNNNPDIFGYYPMYLYHIYGYLLIQAS